VTRAICQIDMHPCETIVTTPTRTLNFNTSRPFLHRLHLDHHAELTGLDFSVVIGWYSTKSRAMQIDLEGVESWLHSFDPSTVLIRDNRKPKLDPAQLSKKLLHSNMPKVQQEQHQASAILSCRFLT
jgi:hypothetical protein